MKRTFYAFLLAFGLSLACSNSVFALRAFFDYQVFYAPGQGPYVECLLKFDGASLSLQKIDDTHYQSRIEVTLIFSDGSKVVDFKKTISTGPEILLGQNGDFVTLERFKLPNGKYDLEVSLLDMNATEQKPEVIGQKVIVDCLDKGVFVSDIELGSAYAKTTAENAFSRSGYDIIPYVSNYFSTDQSSIIFYSEIYNSINYFGEGTPFVVSTYLADRLHKELPDTRRMKREKAGLVIPILQTIDISNVVSGDYHLIVEVVDREGKVVCKKDKDISRNLIVLATQAEPNGMFVTDAQIAGSFAADYTKPDSLLMIIQAHSPIADAQELASINYLTENGTLPQMQSFFYSMWLKRNAIDPKQGWLDYKKQLDIVQGSFGSHIKRGWQTDRGRVYLQYGPPNTQVVRHNSPTVWPFEIWHYYETNTKLRNAKFLFYDNTLAGDFTLLHSDAPNETRNYDWANMVRSRTMSDPASTGRRGNNQISDPYSRDELTDLWYNPH